MNNFIEVQTGEGKLLINEDNIEGVVEISDAECELWFKDNRFIIVMESFESVNAKINRFRK